MDVKVSFLNGLIEVWVYVEQTQGFDVHGRETHVCILKKALYKLSINLMHGILGFMGTYLDWTSLSVRWTQSCNMYLLRVSHSS